MLKKIFLVLVLIMAVFLVIVSLQPSEFRVARSTTINATPVAVFSQVNDFHNWEAWSPWAKLDPNSKAIYEGPSAGTGATFRWSGNNQVGEGSNTITESRPNELIHIKLEFLKPFKGVNDVEFTFKPDGNQTLVTWSMSGHNNFMSKAIGLLMNCEQMVGGQFEKGLAQLKATVEKN